MTEIQSPALKRELGLLDATLIVAGSMIGSGIFIVSADITRHIGSAGWLVAVWVIGGLMTLAAALSYGELSAMYPKAGGQYIYLKEAYNPLVAFVYGWSLFAVIQTGTIAAYGRLSLNLKVKRNLVAIGLLKYATPCTFSNKWNCLSGGRKAGYSK